MTIESLAIEGFKYHIMDMAGRELKHGTVHGQTRFTLDLKPLDPGIYFFRAVSGTHIQTDKLIVN